MSKRMHKTLECDICKKNNTKLYFNDKMSYDKHKWEFHPKNNIEKWWSELKRSGDLYNGKFTLGFQDDPYY